MATLARALESSLGGNRHWATPANVGRLSNLLAEQAGKAPRFGNRLLAGQLGVSIREVQRWRAPEGKQRRSIPAAQGAKLNAAGRAAQARATLARIRDDGMTIAFEGELCDPSGNCRQRAKEVEVDPEESQSLPEFVAAMQAGDARAQERAFTAVFLEAWGITTYEGRGASGWGIGDVESLTL